MAHAVMTEHESKKQREDQKGKKGGVLGPLSDVARQVASGASVLTKPASVAKPASQSAAKSNSNSSGHAPTGSLRQEGQVKPQTKTKAKAQQASTYLIGGSPASTGIPYAAGKQTRQAEPNPQPATRRPTEPINQAFTRSDLDRDTFDTHARNSFAQRHPEQTGGEIGEIERALNTGAVEIASGRKTLDQVIQQYGEKTPQGTVRFKTEEGIKAYEQAFQKLQKSLQEQAGAAKRYSVYFTPEAAQTRIDAIDRKIQEIDGVIARKKQAVDVSDPGRIPHSIMREMEKDKKVIRELEKQRAELRTRTKRETHLKTMLEYERLREEPDFEAYSKRGSSRIEGATEEENQIYNYLIEKDKEQGTRRNIDYGMWLYANVLQPRSGLADAEKIREIDNDLLRLIASAGYSAGAGLDKWARGIDQVVAPWSDPIPTDLQYGAAQIREDVAGMIPGALGVDPGQFALDVANKAGYNIPSILMKGVGISAAGTVANGMSSGGNAYAEAIGQGYEPAQAGAYAVMTGISDMVLNNLFDDLTKAGSDQLSHTGAGKWLQESMQNIKNANLRALADTGTAGLSKLSSPYLQAILAPVYRNLALDEHNEIRLVSEEAAYEALVSFLADQHAVSD